MTPADIKARRVVLTLSVEAKQMLMELARVEYPNLRYAGASTVMERLIRDYYAEIVEEAKTRP